MSLVQEHGFCVRTTYALRKSDCKMNDLNKYLEENYQKSVFDQMEKDRETWILHLHGNRVISGEVKTNKRYDIIFQSENRVEEEIPKHNIKFLCLEKDAREVSKGLKAEDKVKKKKLEPIVNPENRNHIKNKTLFPLMQERALLFFTTLEGDVLSGIVGGFTRYEIQVLGKKRIPVTLLRHAVYDVRDKRKKSYLKKVVEERKKTLKSRNTKQT